MNLKIDDLLKGRNSKKEQLVYDIVIILLIGFAIVGLVVVAKFIGFAYHMGQAGYIYELNLEQRYDAYLWSGVYGVAVRVDGYNNIISYNLTGLSMVEANLLFSCMEKGKAHEVYASTVPSSQIQWDTVQAASTADIDSYLEVNSTNAMSATQTFTHTISVEVGKRNISAPGTYTNKLDENPPATFDVGILKDGLGHILIFAHALNNFSLGFNGRIYNYQMILPIKENSTEVYYFFTDPTDYCPTGQG
jgi:hypothetical protein